LSSFSAAIETGARRLAGSGIDDARREARLLLAEVTGLNSAAIIAYPERTLTDDQAVRLEALLRRREAREPLSRILGWREFWSLRFALGSETLDPRPDSETLIEAALAAVDRNRALSVLDLGTGGGCLLLAFLSEAPNASGLGIDLSDGALAVAEDNARSLGLGDRARFRQGDWGLGLDERFDLILCNPPYIPAGAVESLAPEVAVFDPPLALAGGEDGLAAYRRLSDELPRLLVPGGLAVVEIGAGQAESAGAILAAHGLEPRGSRADLAGITRCLLFGAPVRRPFVNAAGRGPADTSELP
jgi:release factor glutamine methyltransferase